MKKFSQIATLVCLSLFSNSGWAGFDNGKEIEGWYPRSLDSELFVRKSPMGTIRTLRLSISGWGTTFEVEERRTLDSQPIFKKSFLVSGYYQPRGMTEKDGALFLISNRVYSDISPSVIKIDLATGNYIERSNFSAIFTAAGAGSCPHPKLLNLRPTDSGLFVNLNCVVSATVALDNSLAPVSGKALFYPSAFADSSDQKILSLVHCESEEKRCYEAYDLKLGQAKSFQLDTPVYDKFYSADATDWFFFHYYWSENKIQVHKINKSTLEKTTFSFKLFKGGTIGDFEEPIVLPNQDFVLLHNNSNKDGLVTNIYHFGPNGVEKARTSVQGRVTIIYQNGLRSLGEQAVHGDKLYLKTLEEWVYVNPDNERMKVDSFNLYAISLSGDLKVLGHQHFFPKSSLPEGQIFPGNVYSLDTDVWTNLGTLSNDGKVIVGIEKIQKTVVSQQSKLEVTESNTYVFDDQLVLQQKMDTGIMPYFFDGTWMVGSDFGGIGPFKHDPWGQIRGSTYKFFQYQP